MISGVYLFDLASKKVSWLGARSAAIAGNVANANTPGFKSRDVEPFSAVLDKAGGALSVTNTRHISAGSGLDGSTTKTKQADGWDTYVSGNSVSVEQELMKAGEVAREHQLGVSVVRSFHKMILSTVRTGS